MTFQVIYHYKESSFKTFVKCKLGDYYLKVYFDNHGRYSNWMIYNWEKHSNYQDENDKTKAKSRILASLMTFYKILEADRALLTDIGAYPVHTNKE